MAPVLNDYVGRSFKELLQQKPGGPGWTRTNDVSQVTELQSATLAARLLTHIDSDSCFKGRPQLSRGPHCGFHATSKTTNPWRPVESLPILCPWGFLASTPGFNLYSAVPVPAQSSAVLAEGARFERTLAESKSAVLPIERTLYIGPTHLGLGPLRL